MPLIFVETIQHRDLRLIGLDVASFDEQDQFGLSVLSDALSLDPNAARIFARFRHVEIPQSDERRIALV